MQLGEIDLAKQLLINVILDNPDAQGAKARAAMAIPLELQKAGDREVLKALTREAKDDIEKDWQDDMLTRMLKHIDDDQEVHNHNKLDTTTGLPIQRHVDENKFLDSHPAVSRKVLMLIID